jgi:hypothetical protein
MGSFMAENQGEHQPCNKKTPVNAVVYGNPCRNSLISTGFSTGVENFVGRRRPLAESWRIYHSPFDLTIMGQIEAEILD